MKNLLKNFSLRRKLLTGFALCLITIIGGFAASLGQIYRLTSIIHEYHDHPFEVVLAAGEMKATVLRIRSLAEDRREIFTAGTNLEEIRMQEGIAARELGRIKELTLGADGKQLATEAETAFADWKRTNSEIARLRQEGAPAERLASVDEEESRKLATLERKIAALKTHADEQAEEFYQDSIRSSRVIFYILIGFLVLVTLSGVAISIVLAKNIAAPIGAMAVRLQNLAAGDLKSSIDSEFLERNDEVGQLARALSDMNTRLNDLLERVKFSAVGINATAESLNETAREFANNSQSQASATEETSASVEQLSATAENINGSVTRVASFIQEIDGNVKSYHQALNRINESMSSLKERADTSAATARDGQQSVEAAEQIMNAIRESSVRISEIIGLITDISDQTTLLSLNAAIEAARAGEEGRGFAVVADEISKLSERTLSSVKEIRALVTNSNQSVDQGSTQVGEAADIFDTISSHIQNINGAAADVWSSFEEQAAGLNRIASNFESVSNFIKEVETMTHEQRRATQEINQTIQGISSETQSVSEGSTRLLDFAGKMAAQAEDLRAILKTFGL